MRDEPSFLHTEGVALGCLPHCSRKGQVKGAGLSWLEAPGPVAAWIKVSKQGVFPSCSLRARNKDHVQCG